MRIEILRENQTRIRGLPVTKGWPMPEIGDTIDFITENEEGLPTYIKGEVTKRHFSFSTNTSALTVKILIEDVLLVATKVKQ